MANVKKDFRNTKLKLKVKELIKKSKKLNLIKPHTAAFEDTPTKYEQHKGKLVEYRK